MMAILWILFRLYPCLKAISNLLRILSKDFKAFCLSDRIKIVYEKHLYYTCLNRSHIARDCYKPIVTVCRGHRPLK